MGSVSIAAGSLYTPAMYSYITTLHNDRSKVIVYDRNNNILYAGTFDTSVWEVSFQLRAGDGTEGTNFGCGEATQIPFMEELKSDDMVPDRVWASASTVATLVVIDVGATEICLSAAYEGTYDSNFPATTYEPQNGYIYTSFNEKVGGTDAHVFKSQYRGPRGRLTDATP
eukprot:1810779-Rhodomonas_salina.1